MSWEFDPKSLCGPQLYASGESSHLPLSWYFVGTWVPICTLAGIVPSFPSIPQLSLAFTRQVEEAAMNIAFLFELMMDVQVDAGLAKMAGTLSSTQWRLKWWGEIPLRCYGLLSEKVPIRADCSYCIIQLLLCRLKPFVIHWSLGKKSWKNIWIWIFWGVQVAHFQLLEASDPGKWYLWLIAQCRVRRLH